MKIFYYYDIKEIKEDIFNIAKYQKVSIIYTSENKKYLDTIVSAIKKDCQLFLYQCEINNFDNKIFEDGARAYILIVNNSLLNKIINKVPSETALFNFVSKIIVPYFNLSRKNYYLISLNYRKSIIDLMIMFEALINFKWQNILLFKNYGHELAMAENLIKSFELSNDSDFIREAYKISKEIKIVPNYLSPNNLDEDMLTNGYDENIIQSFEKYYYLRLYAIKLLFEMHRDNFSSICDVYKDFENDITMVNLVFNLYFDERINFALKNCCGNMLEFIDEILSYLKNKININEIEINCLINNLKNTIKKSNIDDLLKLSYVYGVFN